MKLMRRIYRKVLLLMSFGKILTTKAFRLSPILIFLQIFLNDQNFYNAFSKAERTKNFSAIFEMFMYTKNDVRVGSDSYYIQSKMSFIN